MTNKEQFYDELTAFLKWNKKSWEELADNENAKYNVTLVACDYVERFDTALELLYQLKESFISQ